MQRRAADMTHQGLLLYKRLEFRVKVATEIRKETTISSRYKKKNSIVRVSAKSKRPRNNETKITITTDKEKKMKNRTVKGIVNLLDLWGSLIRDIDKVDSVGHEAGQHKGVAFAWLSMAAAADIPATVVQFVSYFPHF